MLKAYFVDLNNKPINFVDISVVVKHLDEDVYYYCAVGGSIEKNESDIKIKEEEPDKLKIQRFLPVKEIKSFNIFWDEYHHLH